MKHKKNIILVGGGGHCKSCIEVIESTGLYDIVGILDLPGEVGQWVLGYQMIGTDEDFQKYKDKDCCFLVTAGQIKSPDLRRKIYSELIAIDATIETIIAPTAIVSEHAKVKKGTIVMHHSFINAGAEIGENCIVNTAAIIEHDARIEGHCHISTNAVVNGDVIIGAGSFIGSGSCVSNALTIGENVIVGAGSTVIKSIQNAGTYLGSPANIKKL